VSIERLDLQSAIGRNVEGQRQQEVDERRVEKRVDTRQPSSTPYGASALARRIRFANTNAAIGFGRAMWRACFRCDARRRLVGVEKRARSGWSNQRRHRRFDLRRVAQYSRGDLAGPSVSEQAIHCVVRLRVLSQHVAAQAIQGMKLQVLQVAAQRQKLDMLIGARML